MPVDQFDVEQNGIKINVGTREIKKGKNAGQQYNAPDESALSVDQITQFLGAPKVQEILRSTFRRVSLNIHKEAAEQSKGDNDKYVQLYSKMLKEFTPVGESLAVLEEQLEDLLNQAGDLNPKMTIGPDGKISVDETDADTQKYLKLMLQTKSINEAVEAKRAEKEKAKAEKEAAKAATATTPAQA